MSENVRILNAKQARAAALLAEDELTDAEIAAEAGVTDRTLRRWKEQPEFLDAITEHTQRVQSAMLRLDIAKRHKRVKVLNDLHSKQLDLMEARAQQYAGIPGGDTGLIVRQLKVTSEGVVEEFVFDRALVSEIRAVQEQAASELGQKVDKVAINGEMIVRRYIGVSPEDV